MALSQPEVEMLADELAKTQGLPCGFNGDRLQAFAAGVLAALKGLAPKVTMDKPPEKEKK